MTRAKENPSTRTQITRGTDGTGVRPYTTGITAGTLMERPYDCRCTWTVEHGRFVLKFMDRMCLHHGQS